MELFCQTVTQTKLTTQEKMGIFKATISDPQLPPAKITLHKQVNYKLNTTAIRNAHAGILILDISKDQARLKDDIE